MRHASGRRSHFPFLAPLARCVIYPVSAFTSPLVHIEACAGGSSSVGQDLLAIGKRSWPIIASLFKRNLGDMTLDIRASPPSVIYSSPEIAAGVGLLR